MEGISPGKHGIICLAKLPAIYATVLHFKLNLTKLLAPVNYFVNWELCKIEKTLSLGETAGKIQIFLLIWEMGKMKV